MKLKIEIEIHEGDREAIRKYFRNAYQDCPETIMSYYCDEVK